ncbi:hypothetical protein PRZ48_000225 [Zasmidium cellare]|uniref:Zn(2)-C6 fungal-type domain-containing protein n=1 Tax=Zasmidium cellare TaxID=395010 RepID=A0ABR0EZ53_ZASCE|nr:hypothetical protein PRZ48_000225 [Zasmidium cellare]
MEAPPPPAFDGAAKNLVRSCITCAKAKAKCVKSAGAEKCERCSRLNKECHSKEPVLRRKKVVKTTRAAQLEKLESKIEHLVNTLSSGPQPSYRTNEYGQPSPPISQVSSAQEKTVVGSRTEEVLHSLCHDSNGTVHTGSSGQPTPALAPPSDIPIASAITLSEAEILLDRYCRLMSSGMPFVVIPPGATAQTLFETKPVLLRAICTVAKFHDLPQQQALVKELVKEVAGRVLGESEKSVDIIQGILVFVAWYHPHVFWSHQVTNLLHLAIAMCIDMGIDRSPGQNQDFKAATTKAVHGPCLAQRIPSLEERRSLLGVFYMSSFKKIDAMPFTRYMDDCLNSLEQAREHDSDLFLVQMTRIQHVIEAIHTVDSPSAPARVYIKAFQADIERLKRSDPCKGDNVFLVMQYVTAEILMWELSLIDLQENRTSSLSTHLEDLYRCVAAIQSFLDVWYTIPSSAYYLLPFSVFGQFAHAFIVLTKLASLEVEGWDLKALNEQLNFVSVIHDSAAAFEEATRSTPDGIAVNNDSFGKWSQRIRWMRQVYESKFTAEGNVNAAMREEAERAREWDVSGSEAVQQQQSLQSQSAQQSQLHTPSSENPSTMMNATDVLNADFFNYLDENFWQSFATDFDLSYPAVGPMAHGAEGTRWWTKAG